MDTKELKKISGVQDIKVEHIRSRITRFSKLYSTLHLETRDIVDQLLSNLLEKCPELNDTIEKSRPTLSLGLADSLFFSGLKTKSVELLIEDDEFTDIVVAIEANSRDKEFLSILKSVSGLMKDERVQFMSLSNTFSKTSRIQRTNLKSYK